jgi:hypothetical protein
MNERILLIDSDIFVLLSAAGVLDDLIECLGFKQSNVRRLAALPKQLERGRAFRRYNQAFRDKALACCREFPALLDRPASNCALGGRCCLLIRSTKARHYFLQNWLKAMHRSSPLAISVL